MTLIGTLWARAQEIGSFPRYATMYRGATCAVQCPSPFLGDFTQCPGPGLDLAHPGQRVKVRSSSSKRGGSWPIRRAVAIVA